MVKRINLIQYHFFLNQNFKNFMRLETDKKIKKLVFVIR